MIHTKKEVVVSALFWLLMTIAIVTATSLRHQQLGGDFQEALLSQLTWACISMTATWMLYSFFSIEEEAPTIAALDGGLIFLCSVGTFIGIKFPTIFLITEIVIIFPRCEFQIVRLLNFSKKANIAKNKKIDNP